MGVELWVGVVSVCGTEEAEEELGVGLLCWLSWVRCLHLSVSLMC